MAKATLEFDLTDPDDRVEHLRAVKSTDMALFIWELLYNTKKGILNNLEFNPNYPKDNYELVQYLWTQFHEMANEKGIIIDELIQ
jgi:hypothetical protein